MSTTKSEQPACNCDCHMFVGATNPPDHCKDCLTTPQEEELDSGLYEIRDYISRVAFSNEYNELWDKSVAVSRIDGIMEDIQAYIDKQTSKAKEEFAAHVMLVKTEGLFDNGDLFIKRAPIEQAIIDQIGYEPFRAIKDGIPPAERPGGELLNTGMEKEE